MKVIDLFEYKNKYYKPVPKVSKPRKNKTLWYNDYARWVNDITVRFPHAKAFYDEENEEILAGSDDCIQCYGKWSKKKNDMQGVTFNKARGMRHISKQKQAKLLSKIEIPGGGFSGLF